MDDESCWICGDKEVVYEDIIGSKWCQRDFEEIYLAPRRTE